MCAGTDVKVSDAVSWCEVAVEKERSRAAKAKYNKLADLIMRAKQWNNWFGWLWFLRATDDPDELDREYLSRYPYVPDWYLLNAVQRVLRMCKVSASETVYLTDEELKYIVPKLSATDKKLYQPT